MPPIELPAAAAPLAVNGEAVAFFRYVRHACVSAYEALGWCVVDTFAGTPHAYYSVLMKWAAPGDPVEPQREPT